MCALVVAVAPADKLADRRDPRRVAGLSTPTLDGSHHGGLVGETSSISNMFEYTTGVRQEPTGTLDPVRTRARYCRNASAATSQPSTVSATTTIQCRSSQWRPAAGPQDVEVMQQRVEFDDLWPTGRRPAGAGVSSFQMIGVAKNSSCTTENSSGPMSR